MAASFIAAAIVFSADLTIPALLILLYIRRIRFAESKVFGTLALT
jgi:hypothetical protein